MSEFVEAVSVDIDRWMDHHAPVDQAQVDRYLSNREAAKAFAKTLLENAVHPSDELKTALDAVRTALMWGNAAIACNE